MKPRISWIGIIPLAVFVMLATMLLLRLEHPRTIGSVDSPLIGKKASDYGFQEKGPFLINFFASWCGPCKIEHPFLLVAKGKGVPIIGVAYKDKKEDLDAYIDRMGNPYQRINMDLDGMQGINMGITGVPESFWVDEQGIIQRRMQGAFTSIPDVMTFTGQK